MSGQLTHPEASMIKSIIAAVWIIAVTLAGIYAPALMHGQRGSGEIEPAHAAPEPFKSDHIAVAIFRDGKVAGYFTSRLNCELLDPSLKDSIAARLTHELYKAVYASGEVDFRKPTPEEVSALAAMITKGLNERAGKPVIENLKLEEPDFLRRL
jgi:hypothetical protein